MNRDYDSRRDKINPNYVPLGNYYGNRQVDTNVNYQSARGVQIVPEFAGVSYKNPNYNSLTHGSCVNHAEATNAYIYNNCVTYRARYDGPNGIYYGDEKGYTGNTGTKENYSVDTRGRAAPNPNVGRRR
jgi:hypothetical protein